METINAITQNNIRPADRIYQALDDKKRLFLPFFKNDELLMQKMVSSFIFTLVEKELMDCTIDSIMQAFKKCGEFNLSPSSSGGKIFLLPYFNEKARKKEVNAQIGYKGLVDIIMRRQDIISNVGTEIVYEGDEFDVEYCKDTNYRHVPKFKSKQMSCTYAVLKYKDGNIQIKVSDLHDIANSRKRSKSYNVGFSPWISDYNSMAQIVPLRKLAKVALSLTVDSDDYVSDYDIAKTSREVKAISNCVPRIVSLMSQIENSTLAHNIQNTKPLSQTTDNAQRLITLCVENKIDAKNFTAFFDIKTSQPETVTNAIENFDTLKEEYLNSRKAVEEASVGWQAADVDCQNSLAV